MNPVKHVAIIMDGNGRWGIKHKQSRNAGHRAGLNSVQSIIDHSIKKEIKYLTLYTFSTENWNRPKSEINFLFNLLENFLENKIDRLIKKNIKLKFIGEINKLPIKLKKLIKISELKTSKNLTLQVNVALNYGSKN
jgi:undecaprenyl diphosphate synthase